jgi:two-component system nitrogen regulation response regulator GlnG
LAVNCAAIPEALLESELFGHEKGSFTGADQRRIGKFEQCNGGTIFLDEIGEMPALLQAKLLRLLQEQRFERVGGNETIQTNVRIITATNRNLEEMTRDGAFRLDLFYRLNVFTIQLPALRERGDDLLMLIDSYLCRFGSELKKPLQRVSPDAMKFLLEYDWPGNIRELQNVLKKSLLNASGPILIPEFLPDEVRGGKTSDAAGGDEEGGDIPHDLAPFLRARLAAETENLYAESIDFLERFIITRVMQHCAGNQSAAARLLGITRGSLRNKIQQQQITIEQVVQTEER